MNVFWLFCGLGWLLAFALLAAIVPVVRGRTVFLEELRVSLEELQERWEDIRMTLSQILDKVQQQKTVDDSIVALVSELNTELKAAIANNDPALLQQISDQLDVNIAEIQAAVTANTPAAPAPAAPSTSSTPTAS